jgi:hypothetical protein
MKVSRSYFRQIIGPAHDTWTSDHILPIDGKLGDVLFTIDETTVALTCLVLGHEYVEDNCGIDEHDYCCWCNHRRGGPRPPASREPPASETP